MATNPTSELRPPSADPFSGDEDKIEDDEEVHPFIQIQIGHAVAAGVRPIDWLASRRSRLEAHYQV